MRGAEGPRGHVPYSCRIPVHWLHLPCYANDGAWQEIVKLLKQFPDVGLVLEVEVQLNYPQDLWRKEEENNETQAHVPGGSATEQKMSGNCRNGQWVILTVTE